MSRRLSNRNKRQQDKRRHNSDIDWLLSAGADQDFVVRALGRRYHMSKQDALKAVEQREEARQKRQMNKSAKHQVDRAHQNKDGVPLHMNSELQEIARQSVRAMCLFDDLLFQKCMDGNKAALEAILRPILQDPELEVRDIRIQRTVPALAMEHGVRIDVEALTSSGKIIAVEVQRSDSGAIPERPRFIHAREDTAQHPSGEEYKDLHDVYVIMLCENDPFGDGKPMYHVKKTIEETGQEYIDGSYTIFTNGKYRGDDAMGELMHDMRQVNAEDMYIKPLRESVRDNKAFAMGEVTNVRQATAEQEWFATYEEIIDRNYGGHLAAYRKELKAQKNELVAKDQEIADQKKEIKNKDRALEDKDHTILELRGEIARLRANSDRPQE